MDSTGTCLFTNSINFLLINIIVSSWYSWIKSNLPYHRQICVYMVTGYPGVLCNTNYRTMQSSLLDQNACHWYLLIIPDNNSINSPLIQIHNMFLCFILAFTSEPGDIETESNSLLWFFHSLCQVTIAHRLGGLGSSSHKRTVIYLRHGPNNSDYCHCQCFGLRLKSMQSMKLSWKSLIVLGLHRVLQIV